MRIRDAVLARQETQSSDAATKTIDLDLTDPVSAIWLEFQATNGTTNNEDNFISDVVTKVEIVDGSETLYALRQMQLEALHFAKLKQTPGLFPSEWDSGVQRHGCYLLFGRRLYDPEYAINFTKFKNPQLKITWNLAAIRAVSATTAFATGTFKITAIAKVMEGLAPPGKYLMAKELESYTSSASSGAEERKELPTDYIYRLLMTRHFVAGSDINEVCSDLKLTADMDKYIAFNKKVSDMDAEALGLFGVAEFKHDIHRASSVTVEALLNKELHYRPSLWVANTPRIFSVYNEWSSQFYIQMFTDAGSADTTARRISGRETGHALHATLPIPLGDMDRPESWFDPTGYKKLELVFTSGGTAGVTQIVAEQVRPN